MSRHYWPGPPTSSTQYLVEHKSGEVHRLTLDIDNEWSGDRFRECLRGDLIRNGYLGVRTPFSEEAEIEEFHKVFPRVTDPQDQYGIAEQEFRKEGWLLAKRHERGL